ncbi:MAG: hypothetical protein J7K53_00340 [Bacteroidales bacterium]|nr:hypothetical protein [Bacteroidales bacterium]
MEKWKNGIMERKNINRWFKQLRVWNNSVKLYILTCKLLSKFPYELKKTVSDKLKRINGEFLLLSIRSLLINDYSLAVQAGIIPTFHYSNIPK